MLPCVTMCYQSSGNAKAGVIPRKEVGVPTVPTFLGRYYLYTGDQEADRSDVGPLMYSIYPKIMGTWEQMANS